MAAMMGNSVILKPASDTPGQVCESGTRLLLPSSLYDDFMQRQKLSEVSIKEQDLWQPALRSR